jgi:hypothetical protein
MVARGSARGWVAAGVMFAVALGAAAAVAVALGEGLGVDAVVIVPGRRAVSVTGTLRCTAGQGGGMRVTVTQPGRRAIGTTQVRCDGRQSMWRVRARTARGMRLSPGMAGVSVTITFGATGNTQRGIGVAGFVRLRCPSSRQQNGVIDEIALSAPGGGSQAHGTALISRRRGRWQISVLAQHVPPNGRADAYAVWLHSASGDDRLLGFVNPGVGRDRRIRTMGQLPVTVGCYQQVVVSRETAATPKHPRTTLLAGPIKIG